MFGLIESLRNKSEGYRRGVAFGTSFVVTLVIFGIWMTVIFPNAIPGDAIVATSQTGASTVVTTETREDNSRFTANVAQSISSLKMQWKSISQYFNSSLGQTEYQAENQLQVIVPEQESSAVTSHNSATDMESSVIY